MARRHSSGARIVGMPRWLALAMLATAFAVAWPKPADAGDRVRVVVDFGDVVLRGGQPYYRYGGYRDADRLLVARDRYGRPVYYRYVDRYVDRGPDRGYRYRRHDADRYRGPYDDPRRVDTARRVDCNSRGNCTVTWQDPYYDRGGYAPRHGGSHRWQDDDHQGDDDR